MTTPPVASASVDWSSSLEVQPAAANQFLLQAVHGGDGKPAEIVFTLGSMVPPILLADQPTAIERGDDIKIQIHTVARVMFSVPRFRELAELFARVSSALDEMEDPDADHRDIDGA